MNEDGFLENMGPKDTSKVNRGIMGATGTTDN